MTTTRPGYTRCTYAGALVPLGRARSKCPHCGATLQTTAPGHYHYIAPHGIDRSAPGNRVGPHALDVHPHEPEHP